MYWKSFFCCGIGIPLISQKSQKTFKFSTKARKKEICVYVLGHIKWEVMKKERNSTESYLLTWKEATKIINNWCILSHVKWELKEKEIKTGASGHTKRRDSYRRLCSTEDPRACLSLSIIANSVIGNYVQYVNNRIQSIQGHKTTILVTE